MKKKCVLLMILVVSVIVFFSMGGIAVFADESGEQLNQSITDLLKDLDLNELQKYLDENKDSYLFNFGDTASEIIEYLIHGNLNTDYGGYLSELFSVIFKNVIKLIPAFAEVTAIALLSAVVSTAEGTLMGKSTSKVVHLACYSLIILIISSMLIGIVSDCITCINSVRKQIK